MNSIDQQPASIKCERKMLKACLLGYLHQLLRELFFEKMEDHQSQFLMEYYTMDNKLIQRLICEIVGTKQYTLEGIAYYTCVPFDVIYEAACGINNQISHTAWVRVVSLYLQVKPDIGQLLINKLLEIKEKNNHALLILLNE